VAAQRLWIAATTSSVNCINHFASDPGDYPEARCRRRAVRARFTYRLYPQDRTGGASADRYPQPPGGCGVGVVCADARSPRPQTILGSNGIRTFLNWRSACGASKGRGELPDAPHARCVNCKIASPRCNDGDSASCRCVGRRRRIDAEARVLGLSQQRNRPPSPLRTTHPVVLALVGEDAIRGQRHAHHCNRGFWIQVRHIPLSRCSSAQQPDHPPECRTEMVAAWIRQRQTPRPDNTLFLARALRFSRNRRAARTGSECGMVGQPACC
jgi:hypothetical protein